MEYSEFLRRARERHNNKFTYDEETRRMFNGSHSIISVICLVHGRYEIMAKNHLKYDCEKCFYIARGLKFRSNIEEFTKKANLVHNGKYDYSDSEYLDAKTQMNIICPIHGEFKQTPNDHLNGEGCPRCNDSYLERDVRKHCENKSIGYEQHKHFGWLGKQEIDFYFGDKDIGIECQGKQHIGLGGWKEGYDFPKLFELDAKKNNLCKENGIRLYYLIDKEFYEQALEMDLYNKDNLFYDMDELFEKING